MNIRQLISRHVSKRLIVNVLMTSQAAPCARLRHQPFCFGKLINHIDHRSHHRWKSSAVQVWISSYCSAESRPLPPASSSSGSTVWSPEVPRCSSSSAPHHHHPTPPPPPSDSPSILGDLTSGPSDTSSAPSSQMWQCSPAAAGTEYYMNHKILLNPRV